MVVTLFGIVTLARLTHVWNVPSAMKVTPFGIVMLVRLPQFQNAPAPILVTLFGIVTLVRPLPKNAEPPMLVTSRPLIMGGMITARLGPVYPVMVTVRSALIVYARSEVILP